MLEQQVILTNDGILDEAVAGLGDLLLFLVSGAEFTRVANSDRASESISEFDPVEQVLDRHAQFDIINVTQDEHGLNDPAKCLERRIETVLPGVGIQPPEDVRCGAFFQFNGSDETQNIVPSADD